MQAHLLHGQMLRYASLVAPDQSEEHSRRAAIERTVSCVRQHWPQAQVLVIGSTATSLTLPSSDIDLVAVLSAYPTEKQAQLAQLRPLGRKLWRLAASGSLQVIPARVPIISWTDSASGLQLDLSVNAPSGLHNSEVVRRVLTWCPMLRPLLVVLKSFLLQHDLHKTRDGGVGSYLLFVMAHSIAQRRISQGGDCASAGALLLDFLQTYGALPNLHHISDVTAASPLLAKRFSCSSV